MEGESKVILVNDQNIKLRLYLWIKIVYIYIFY